MEIVGMKPDYNSINSKIDVFTALKKPQLEINCGLLFYSN
jgi:hypothetical protein